MCSRHFDCPMGLKQVRLAALFRIPAACTLPDGLAACLAPPPARPPLAAAPARLPCSAAPVGGAAVVRGARTEAWCLLHCSRQGRHSRSAVKQQACIALFIA